jgi:NADH:ubiquinone oxidoreductase subunit E
MGEHDTRTPRHRVEICMGSSCFLKGSYQVLDAFQELCRRHALQETVAIAGAFCKEHCRDGVSVEIDGQLFSVPDAEAAHALFTAHFLRGPETSS